MSYPWGNPNAKPVEPTLYQRYRATKSAGWGEIRDEVIELVGRSFLFGVDELILLMKAGYKSLPKREKSEFMRRVLFELKKSEVSTTGGGS